MSFTLTPVDVIQAPNFYKPTASGTFDLVDPNPITLNFLLTIVDSLGSRPYFATMNSTLTLAFNRMNQFTNGAVNPIETVQSLIRVATRNTQNPALYSVALTTQDVQTVRSGSLQFTLVENGVSLVTNLNWMLTKKLANYPGC